MIAAFLLLSLPTCFYFYKLMMEDYTDEGFTQAAKKITRGINGPNLFMV